MGRTAIVTGSDSGIGEATAVALAEAGCDVGVTWHQDKQGAAVVDRLAEDLGGLDVLVNNAGTGMATPFLDQTLEDWRHLLEVDLTGAFVCAQAAARRMVAAGRDGRIVNEDTDPRTVDRPASPWAGPATPARSPRPSSGWPRRRPATPPGPRSWSTAGCC